MKKRSKNRKSRVLIVLMAFVLLLGTSFWVLPDNKVNAAVAPGCPSPRPTAITGTVKAIGGTYNGWAVNVLVGMDLHNAEGKKVTIDGKVMGSGYSYTDAVNPSLTPPGATSGYEMTFGRNLADGNGILCVSRSVTKVYFELYPKGTDGKTQKIHFGGSSDQNMTVKPGATNSYAVRLPTAYAYGGNTGDINGYITYRGHLVNPSYLTFRAFPLSWGTACGTQGFSAGANQIGASVKNDQTYYRMSNMAAGQCGASYQKYKTIVTCKTVCGASSRSKSIDVKVARGKVPRVDFVF